MSAVSPDQISTVAIRLKQDGDPTFMLLMTREGQIRRMGHSALDGTERTIAAGEIEGAFEDLMASLAPGLLNRGGSYVADAGEGIHCDWRIELAGGPAPISFELQYHSESAALPKAIADMVATAERLTGAWYAEKLEAEPFERGSPVPMRAPTEAYDGGGETDEDGTEESDDEEQEQEQEEKAAPPKEVVLPGREAPKWRLVLAVVLDFFILSVPFAFARLALGGDDAPALPGGGLVLFVIVEVALVQFLRRSPGLWLLGIDYPLGRAPQLGDRHHERETLATLIIGALLTLGGARAMTSWMTVHTPPPYFGISMGMGASVAITCFLAALTLTAGLLILRTDLRGVWVGAGAAGLTALAVLFGWSDWRIWSELALAERRALQGRMVQSGEFESASGFIRPALMIGILLSAAALVYCWYQLRAPERSRSPAARR